MRNIIRTALVIGTLATPMIAMADEPKKDAPAKTDEKADMKEGKKDAKAPAKKDAKAPAKKDAAKDAKEPASK
jgi:hypothetical protein